MYAKFNSTRLIMILDSLVDMTNLFELQANE